MGSRDYPSEIEESDEALSSPLSITEMIRNFHDAPKLGICRSILDGILLPSPGLLIQLKRKPKPGGTPLEIIDALETIIAPLRHVCSIELGSGIQHMLRKM